MTVDPLEGGPVAVCHDELVQDLPLSHAIGDPIAPPISACPFDKYRPADPGQRSAIPGAWPAALTCFFAGNISDEATVTLSNIGGEAMRGIATAKAIAALIGEHRVHPVQAPPSRTIVLCSSLPPSRDRRSTPHDSVPPDSFPPPEFPTPSGWWIASTRCRPSSDRCS
jgi:hypothetical protein